MLFLFRKETVKYTYTSIPSIYTPVSPLIMAPTYELKPINNKNLQIRKQMKTNVHLSDIGPINEEEPGSLVIEYGNMMSLGGPTKQTMKNLFHQMENPFTASLREVKKDPMLQYAINNAEKVKTMSGMPNKRSRQASHVDTYMKNQGEGTRLSVGGGERRSLDQHVFVKRRKKYFLLQKRGQILGDLMSNTSDRRLLERLRDVMVWKIVGRWEKLCLSMTFFAWHGCMIRSKEEIKRFEKFFIKTPVDIKRNTLKHWRRYVSDALASKAKSHLQESMMALEARSGTMQATSNELKSLKNQLYQQRSTIGALEKQKSEMGEMMSAMEKKIEVQRLEEKDLKQQLNHLKSELMKYVKTDSDKKK